MAGVSGNVKDELAVVIKHNGPIPGPLADACLAAAEVETPTSCTGMAATWCPTHGDCSCPPRYPHDPSSERTLDDPRCALHGDASSHAAAEVEP